MKNDKSRIVDSENLKLFYAPDAAEYAELRKLGNEKAWLSIEARFVEEVKR